MDADAISTLLDALRRTEVVDLEGLVERGVVTVPEGCRLEDVSKFLPPPARVRQRVTLSTVESFVGYVNAYAEPSATVFADENVGTFEAVLDYHVPVKGRDDDGRGDCDHVAHYAAPHSIAWKAWDTRNGQWMNQTDFATFVESRLSEIVAPPAADLMQLALELQVHKAAEFRSSIVLQNGQTQLRYEENLSGSTRNGELKVPKSFRFAVPIFEGEKPTEVEALFRYRLQEAKLSVAFVIVEREKLVANAAAAVAAEIRKGLLPSLQYFRGKRG